VKPHTGRKSRTTRFQASFTLKILRALSASSCVCDHTKLHFAHHYKATRFRLTGLTGLPRRSVPHGPEGCCTWAGSPSSAGSPPGRPPQGTRKRKSGPPLARRTSPGSWHSSGQSAARPRPQQRSAPEQHRGPGCRLQSPANQTSLSAALQ
jgi:hypothetical protein